MNTVDALEAALRYWTEDPDRCDMEGREREVAEHLAAALPTDQAAHDVARLWRPAALNWGPPASTVREVYPELTAALDRLSAALIERRHPS